MQSKLAIAAALPEQTYRVYRVRKGGVRDVEPTPQLGTRRRWDMSKREAEATVAQILRLVPEQNRQYVIVPQGADKT
jgi:Asp-tRNA(Asn)/Glu-tRNA(Gln) amidotransferase C subunit